jgi:hypothetical protein
VLRIALWRLVYFPWTVNLRPFLSVTAQRQDSAQQPLASSCARSAQCDYSSEPGSWPHISKHSGEKSRCGT